MNEICLLNKIQIFEEAQAWKHHVTNHVATCEIPESSNLILHSAPKRNSPKIFFNIVIVWRRCGSDRHVLFCLDFLALPAAQECLRPHRGLYRSSWYHQFIFHYSSYFIYCDILGFRLEHQSIDMQSTNGSLAQFYCTKGIPFGPGSGNAKFAKEEFRNRNCRSTNKTEDVKHTQNTRLDCYVDEMKPPKVKSREQLQ